MTELELQKYLRGPRVTTMEKYKKNIHTLEEEYGIVARQSEVYPELYLFKYSQIDSPMGERIVQESRGIILNGDNNWSIVARPYDKFFNYGEGHAPEIDWSTATCYDKLDGSLMTLYWYNGKWNVATSGNPDAAGEVWNALGRKVTFRSLFWDTWHQLGLELPDPYFKHFCFMFELMTPYNKVVVQHKDYKLALHGSRNPATGHYVDPESWGRQYGWPVAETFPLNNIDSIIAAADKLSPTDQEGYVVVDGMYNRVKVKSPQYVALHHMRDSLSPRRMLEIVATNESEEFLNYFEEFRDLHNEIKDKF